MSRSQARCSRCGHYRYEVDRYRRQHRAPLGCAKSGKRHRWTSAPRLAPVDSGPRATLLSEIPVNSAFVHPALPPVKTETYTYVEHHFSCGNCGLHTPGHIDPAIGSGGNGWPTKGDARAALALHQRTCKP